MSNLYEPLAPISQLHKPIKPSAAVLPFCRLTLQELSFTKQAFPSILSSWLMPASPYPTMQYLEHSLRELGSTSFAERNLCYGGEQNKTLSIPRKNCIRTKKGLICSKQKRLRKTKVEFSPRYYTNVAQFITIYPKKNMQHVEHFCRELSNTPFSDHNLSYGKGIIFYRFPQHCFHNQSVYIYIFKNSCYVSSFLSFCIDTTQLLHR